MSEKTACPNKGIWSRVFAGAFAFALLAAVPVLALPVLGADLLSMAPAAGEVVQSPLTFDAPTTNLLKVKPAPSGSIEGLAAAKADAVLLSKWQYSYDLLTALALGGISTTPTVDANTNLLLVTALFSQQAMLLSEATPQMAPFLLQLFNEQNTIIANLLGVPPPTTAM